MNIRQLFGGEADDPKYATSFKRSTAAMIDIWVTLIIRAFCMQLLGNLWLKDHLIRFQEEFYQAFGTETIKGTPEHINFIIHHYVFIYWIIFYVIILFVGALYHAYFNSSAWRGTLGKRIMKITIVDSQENPISLLKGFAHYFLSVLPFVYIIFLLSYQIRHQLAFYDAITATTANVFFGILFVSWVQIHFFTKKKTTAYDIICDTTLVNGRTAAKLPWHKVEENNENNT